MRRMFSASVGPISAAILLVAAPAAHADPLLITGGTINADHQYGASGYLLTGDNFSIPGNYYVVPLTVFAEGALVNMSQQLGGFGPTTTPTINGVTYKNASVVASFNVAARPFVVPSGAYLSYQSFSTPFTLSGSAMGYSDMTHHGTPLFDVDLIGQGTLFLSAKNIGGRWLSEGFALRFAPPSAPTPTPEPATLLLMSGGLAACVARARKRHHR